MDKIQCILNQKTVSLLGINSLFGKVTSLLLKQCNSIKSLILYDDKDISTAYDVAAINTPCQVKAYLGREQLQCALKGADVILIGDDTNCYCDSPEVLLEENATRIIELGMAIAQSDTKAVVLVATNPVNSMLPLLSKVLCHNNAYDCNKVIGVTAVDNMRANAYLARYLKDDPKGIVLPVIGGSSPDTRVPVFSQSRPFVNFSKKIMKKMTKEIQYADRAVFSCKKEVESLNRAYATTRFMHSVLAGLRGEKNVAEIALTKSVLLPGTNYFALPFIMGCEGIEHRFQLPELNAFEKKLLSHAVVEVDRDSKKGENHFKEDVNLKDSKEKGLTINKLFSQLRESLTGSKGNIEYTLMSNKPSLEIPPQVAPSTLPIPARVLPNETNGDCLPLELPIPPVDKRCPPNLLPCENELAAEDNENGISPKCETQQINHPSPRAPCCFGISSKLGDESDHVQLSQSPVQNENLSNHDRQHSCDTSCQPLDSSCYPYEKDHYYVEEQEEKSKKSDQEQRLQQESVEQDSKTCGEDKCTKAQEINNLVKKDDTKNKSDESGQQSPPPSACFDTSSKDTKTDKTEDVEADKTEDVEADKIKSQVKAVEVNLKTEPIVELISNLTKKKLFTFPLKNKTTSSDVSEVIDLSQVAGKPVDIVEISHIESPNGKIVVNVLKLPENNKLKSTLLFKKDSTINLTNEKKRFTLIKRWGSLLFDRGKKSDSRFKEMKLTGAEDCPKMKKMASNEKPKKEEKYIPKIDKDETSSQNVENTNQIYTFQPSNKVTSPTYAPKCPRQYLFGEYIPHKIIKEENLNFYNVKESSTRNIELPTFKSEQKKSPTNYYISNNVPLTISPTTRINLKKRIQEKLKSFENLKSYENNLEMRKMPKTIMNQPYVPNPPLYPMNTYKSSKMEWNKDGYHVTGHSVIPLTSPNAGDIKFTVPEARKNIKKGHVETCNCELCKKQFPEI